MFDDRAGILTELVDDDRIDAQRAAMKLGRIARFMTSNPDEYAALELAAVMGWTPLYTHNRIALATALTTRFPATFAALSAGEIPEYKAGRIVEAVEVLSDEDVARVEAEIAAQAGKWSSRQLSYRLRRAVACADPEAAARRAALKSAARRVMRTNLGDGEASLTFQGDVERIQIAHDRIRAAAKQIKTAGDGRTLDQITFDIGLDTLAGKGLENAKVHVRLTLPATTVLGVDSKPGYLAGYGWLPAQRALKLAVQKEAVWQRILTDPLTGHAVDVGRRKYRPPAALRDHLEAIYPTCTGPGCRKPAHLCDLDHVTPFPMGATDQETVRPACRSHHRAKTHGGWRIELSENGLGLTWVTKHGYRFTHEPEPIADPEPAPF
jgi:hypothetical protein